MFSERENCFYYPYKAITVFTLKQFLLGKKSRFETLIAKKELSEEKIVVARRYIIIIEEILRTEYFETCELEVIKLMAWLKKDDVYFKNEIEKLRKKLLLMTQNLQEMILANNTYIIPDEKEIWQESIMRYEMEIEKIREEIQVYEYKLVLCRNLKGIISRPNGFFNAVYK